MGHAYPRGRVGRRGSRRGVRQRGNRLYAAGDPSGDGRDRTRLVLLGSLGGDHWPALAYGRRATGANPVTGARVRLGILGVIAMLWVPRLKDIPTGPQKIPPVTILIANTTGSDIQVARRGEFVLWLPRAFGPGLPRLGGRFELSAAGGNTRSDQVLHVAPGSNITVVANLLGQERFLPILEVGDCDLSFSAQTNLGTRVSPDVPFQRAELEGHRLVWNLSAGSEAPSTRPASRPVE